MMRPSISRTRFPFSSTFSCRAPHLPHLVPWKLRVDPTRRTPPSISAASPTLTASKWSPTRQGVRFSSARSTLQDRGTRSPDVLLEPPRPARASLAGQDEVEARDPGEELPAGAGLRARVGRDPLAAPAVLAREPRRQLPAVGEDPRVQLPAHLGGRHGVRPLGGLVDEPEPDHLPPSPAPAPP